MLFSLLLKPDVYLDPGSGSLIIQIVIAALLGAGVTIRLFWKKIAKLFSKNKGQEEQDIDENPEEDASETYNMSEQNES